MKNLLLLLALLWVWAQGASAQGAAPVLPNVVVVRVVDYRTKATLYVTRGAGQTEQIDTKVPFLGFDKSMVAVSEAYQLLLQQLYQQGYRLQHTLGTSGPPGPAPDVFTLIFVRPT